MNMFFFPEMMNRAIIARLRISGVFARIEGIGYFFHLGVSMDSMRKYCEKVYRLNGLEITPLVFLSRKSARHIMSAIHILNQLENLPGVMSYPKQPMDRAA
jgi:hypothetical protein